MDAYTVYLVTAYEVANGIEADSTQAQVTGTRAMVFQSMQSVGGIDALSDADRQSVAEGLILQAALYDAIGEAVRNEPELARKVRGDVATAALDMGLDLSQFRMGPNGLARK